MTHSWPPEAQRMAEVSGGRAAVVGCDMPVVGHRGRPGLSQHQPACFSALDVEAEAGQVWHWGGFRGTEGPVAQGRALWAGPGSEVLVAEQGTVLKGLPAPLPHD